MQGSTNTPHDVRLLIALEEYLINRFPLGARQAYKISRYVDVRFVPRKPVKSAEKRIYFRAKTVSR